MKKLLKLAIALMMVLSVTACGGSKQETGNAEIEIWHTFTKGQEELLNTLANEFMAANEGITVKVVNTGSSGEFQGKVTDSVINGVGPNLIFEYASYAKSFDIEGVNYLLSFEDYWDFDFRSTLSSDTYYKEGTNFSDGKLHVAPVYTAGMLLFCNQDLFDQAGVAIPTTWEELTTASKTIYDKLGVPGYVLDSPSDFMQLLIYQSNGGTLVDLDKNQVAFNNAEVLKWLQWWEEGVKAGYFQTGPSVDYCSSDINNGLVASYTGSSAGIPYLTVKNLTVTRVPMMSTAETENAGIIWTRGAIGFNTGNEAENQATADFVKFFVEQNERWVIELNANSPYKAVLESPTYQAHVANDKALTALAEQIPVSFVAPVFTGVTEMRNELGTLIKGVANKDFNAKNALQQVADNVNKAMKGE